MSAGKRRGPAVHTLEARAKMSASHQGLRHTEETRAKISASNMGRVVSAETRAKIRTSLTGRKHTLEARANIGAGVRAAALRRRKARQAAT